MGEMACFEYVNFNYLRCDNEQANAKLLPAAKPLVSCGLKRQAMRMDGPIPHPNPHIRLYLLAYT